MKKKTYEDGIKDALKRIKEANLSKTLVSEIPDDEWDEWNKSDEVALVTDPDEDF